MKRNILAENMLRFGTKNLSESQQKELTLKSIMKTIREHGLTESVKSLLSEAVIKYDSKALNAWIESLKQAYNKQNQTLRAGQFYHANSGNVYTNNAIGDGSLWLMGTVGTFKSARMDIGGTTVTIPVFINPILAGNAGERPKWQRKMTGENLEVTGNWDGYYYSTVTDLATAMKHANATPISVLKAAYAGAKNNAQFTQQVAALPDTVKKQIQGNLKTMLGV